MKALAHVAILLWAIFTTSGSVVAQTSGTSKVYDFFTVDDRHYQHQFHIETLDDKLVGDITIFERQYYDVSAPPKRLDQAAPQVVPFKGTVQPGMKFTIVFDDKAPYDTPKGQEKQTEWQILRRPEGMSLIVPWSVFINDEPPLWKDRKLELLDRAALDRKKVDEAASLATAASTRATQPEPQQASIPSTITVEALYTWDVTVWVGRKYAWMADGYENHYSSVKVEVKAKTRSEAEEIALSRSYTARSKVFGTPIKAEPAGTRNAPYRCTIAEATRQ